ncbi:hypothetical protein ACQ4WX_22230 [Streptomyces lasalocidi]
MDHSSPPENPTLALRTYAGTARREHETAHQRARDETTPEVITLAERERRRQQPQAPTNHE